MAGMSEAQARRVLDDPKSTPEQRRQAEIVLGMPPAGSGNVVGPAGVPTGEGAGPPGHPPQRQWPDPPPKSAEMKPSEQSNLERAIAEGQARLRQQRLNQREREAALEAMDLSKYEK